MNPQFDSTPGLNLPEPSLTAEPVNPMAPPQIAQPYAQPQQPVVAQTMAPQPQMQPIPQTQPSPITPQSVPQPQQQAPQQAASSNEDDIEQQWINKTKSAVTQFQMDPYSQSNAISRIKAEYLQTRHNITTKLGGDS